MMLIPYRLETIYTRTPYSNISIITLNVLMFFFLIFEVIGIEDAQSLVLQDWDLSQMIGNTFLHGGFMHLMGNMVFLWVFGNAVCATVGNGTYPFLYLFLGISASAAQLLFDGRPAIGASGAINGIVGMSLILFPVNRLHCWYFFSLPFLGILWKSGKFKVRAYWMIIAWVIFDVLGIIAGGGSTAYWAHIGGFAAGLLIGSALLYFNAIETYDPTFFDVLAGRPLERTSYDLNELAAMPLPAAPALAFQKQKEQSRPNRTFLGSRPAPAIPSTLVSDPLPVFRVTNVIQKGNDLLVFFVNDGDPVRNVSLTAPTGTPGVVQPAMQIGKREMGTMRLTNVAQDSLGILNLSISFSAGTAKTTKQLIFDETAKTFTAE
jgi:membrane associated rhomboid family serine protease